MRGGAERLSVQRPKAPELVVVLLSAVLLVGSVVGLTRSRGDQGGTETAEPAAPGGPTAVEIVDFSFEPDPVTVAVGDTIEWTNVDSAEHNVTGSEGDTLKSEDLVQDDTYEATFEEAGTFEYACTIHPSMQATVTVEG